MIVANPGLANKDRTKSGRLKYNNVNILLSVAVVENMEDVTKGK